MDREDLKEFSNISESFGYDKEPILGTVNEFETLVQFQGISNSFIYENRDDSIIAPLLLQDDSDKILSEETLDDFDTAYEALRTGVEQELKGFVTNLLANNVENFLWSFLNPTSEMFKDAWNHVLIKFTVSDERMRDQFLTRIRLLFRNIFLEKYETNEEDSMALADAYWTVFKVAINQLLDKMKNNVGQTTLPAQDASTDDIVYR